MSRLVALLLSGMLYLSPNIRSQNLTFSYTSCAERLFSRRHVAAGLITEYPTLPRSRFPSDRIIIRVVQLDVVDYLDLISLLHRM